MTWAKQTGDGIQIEFQRTGEKYVKKKGWGQKIVNPDKANCREKVDAVAKSDLESTFFKKHNSKDTTLHWL